MQTTNNPHIAGFPKERIKRKKSPFHYSKFNGKMVQNGLMFNDNFETTQEQGMAQTKEDRLFNKVNPNL